MTFTTQIKSKEQLSLVSKLIKISAFKKDLEFDYNLYKKNRKERLHFFSLTSLGTLFNMHQFSLVFIPDCCMLACVGKEKHIVFFPLYILPDRKRKNR